METTSTVVPYFLYSSGILLREGLEALLVIIALVAGAREAGQESRARDIYAGGLLAVGVIYHSRPAGLIMGFPRGVEETPRSTSDYTDILWRPGDDIEGVYAKYQKVVASIRPY